MNKKLFVYTPLAAAIAAAISLAALAQSPKPQEDFSPKPPVMPKSPEETIKNTQLPPGYRLEVVLSEPDIREPVMIEFDGDGRMFVAEMRTYMQDADATGEHEPKSAVTLHWSSKRDNVYDKHTVFADNLLLPRIMLPLDKNRVLIGETDTNDLYIYTDTNDDGVSDKKDLFYEGGKRGGNMEHQPNGPTWAMDNWLYTTYNNYRLRWLPGDKVAKQAIAANGGQWGVSQDNWGKVWFVNAGGEAGPVNFQTGVVYGGFRLADDFPKSFKEVFPAMGLADVQGGTSRYRAEDGTLNHFTATCGSQTYRGDRLPEELRGDFFFGEPVGRLIRRSKVTVKEGITSLSNPYEEQRSEFIRSKDALFRPINMNTAPDGTLFIVDMYRGIIQEGGWTGKGSYLRKKIDQYGMAEQIGMGRVYRLAHETTKLGPMPSMNSEKPAKLVTYLAHPNGWWRDMAQRLLVIKQDKSVVGDLTKMARKHKDPLARAHAIWTLEGLDAVNVALIREHLKDKNPKIRANALRVSETLYNRGEASLEADIRTAAQDPDAEVALQSLLTAKLLDFPNLKDRYEGAVANSPHRGVREIGEKVLNPQQQRPITTNAAELKLFKDGEATFQSLCSTCHAANGRGLPMTGGAPGAMLAPSLSGSQTVNSPESFVRVLLHGLSGDIDGKKYEGLMVGMGTNTDDWIASIASYVRNSFGNRASFVKVEDVAKIRAAHKDRTQPWTIPELRAAPKP